MGPFVGAFLFSVRFVISLRSVTFSFLRSFTVPLLANRRALGPDVRTNKARLSRLEINGRSTINLKWLGGASDDRSVVDSPHWYRNLLGFTRHSLNTRNEVRIRYLSNGLPDGGDFKVNFFGSRRDEKVLPAVNLPFKLRNPVIEFLGQNPPAGLKLTKITNNSLQDI